MSEFIDCPNCGHEPAVSHPVSVSAGLYAEKQARVWPQTYAGIDEAEPLPVDEAPGLQVTIDQSAYATENHFKHRRYFENMDHIDVTDIEPGLVEIRFNGGNSTITAFKCRDCNHVWDRHVGTLTPGESK